MLLLVLLKLPRQHGKLIAWEGGFQDLGTHGNPTWLKIIQVSRWFCVVGIKRLERQKAKNTVKKTIQ